MSPTTSDGARVVQLTEGAPMKVLAAAAIGAVVLLTGCAGGDETPRADPTAEGTSAAGSGAASATTEVPDSCPNPEGGRCLGPLDAGAYDTSVFQPRLRYAVPDGTWANMEDLPGNFLLYRPQDPQDGVVGGSYLGVYQDVRAPDTDCAEAAEADVGSTPEELVEFYEAVPGLQVSRPRKVSVGGLDGYRLDFAVRRKDALCSYDGFPGTPLIIGNGVSSLHHVVLPQLDVRLFLLEWRGGNVTIESTNVRKQYRAAEWRALTRPLLDSFEFR